MNDDVNNISMEHYNGTAATLAPHISISNRLLSNADKIRQSWLVVKSTYHQLSSYIVSSMITKIEHPDGCYSSKH